MMSRDQKLLFLKEVLHRKDILFGSFNDLSEGHRKKKQAWEDILTVLKCNGYHGDTTYCKLRDNTWKNIRTATMKKVDNRKQTGAEGGPGNQLNDVDELVLQIVGKESPAVTGLPVAESTVHQSTSPVNVTLQRADCSANSNPSMMQLLSSSGSDAVTSPNVALDESKSQRVIQSEATTKSKRKANCDERVSEKDKLVMKYLRLKTKKVKMELVLLRAELVRQNFDPSEIDSDSETH